MRFIDLCAGIGGGHLGIKQCLPFATCVGFSEIDKGATKIYNKIFPEAKNLGDITTIKANDIEDFDLLIAGFPCQSFSTVGQRKGFEGKQGSVIFNILHIVKEKMPAIIILENVRGILNHDSGKTMHTILSEFSKLGYMHKHEILNSKHFGVPQSRNRVYIVASLDENFHNFKFPETSESHNWDKIKENVLCRIDIKTLFTRFQSTKYINKGSVAQLISSLNDKDVVDIRQSIVHVYKGYFPTLRAQRHGLMFVKDKHLCSLDGKNALRLQGFTEDFISNVQEFTSNNKLLFYAGNAMTVNVVFHICNSLKNAGIILD